MMNVKNIILGIGIVIVFALVLWQGIESFYPFPQWDDYCDDTRERVPKPVGAEGSQEIFNDEATCLDNEGEWKGTYCDYYSECEAEFDAASDKHSWAVFVISLIVAIVAVIVGYSWLSAEPVGSALIASGVWAIFYGSVINWRNFGNTWRFIILAIALVVLIWVALRLNRKGKKFWKK